MASGPNKNRPWAWVDSGAQSSLATIETGVLFRPIRPADPIVCHYAGGQEVATNIAVDIGPEEFHMVKGLEDNLFSPIKLIDDGFVMTVDLSGGSLSKPGTDSYLPIYKSDRGFRIWLKDLQFMNDMKYINEDKPTSTKRYTSDQISHMSFMNTCRRANAMSLAMDAQRSAQLAQQLKFMFELVKESNALWCNSEGAPESISEGALKAMCDAALPKPSTACAEYSEIKPYHLPTLKAHRIYGASVMEEFRSIHDAMGHPSLRQFLKAISGVHPTWTNCPLTDGQIRRCYKDFHCPHCTLAKRKRVTPINDDTAYVDPDKLWKKSSTCSPGNILSIDPSPMNPVASNGHSWRWLIKDIATGYNWACTTKSKEATSAVAVLETVVVFLRSENHETRIIRTDSEAIFQSATMQAYCEKENFQLEHSIPFSKEQSAVERDMQTVNQGIALLLASQPWLRKDKWDYAMFHYVNLRNRTWNTNCARFGDRTPHHIMTGKPTDLKREFQFVFGDIVAVNVPEELKEWKFDTRNQIGIYVGEDSKTKGGHLIYWPYTHAVQTRDTITKLEITDAQFLHYFSKLINAKTKSLPYQTIDIAIEDFRDSADFRHVPVPITAETLHESDWKDARLGLAQQLFDDSSELVFPSIIQPDPTGVPRPILKRSSVPNAFPNKSGRTVMIDESRNSSSSSAANNRPPPKPSFEHHFPKPYEDDAIIDLFMWAHQESPHYLCRRLTVAKALQSDQREEWIEAIKAEVNLLFSRGTLERVPAHLVPKTNRKIIHSTMQLKIKLLQSGLIDKIKARLCACGNELWSASAETYSPTIGALAYATVHQLAVIDAMEMCTVDTVGAYLYQEYPDSFPPIYLVLPANVAQICGLDPTDHYRIRRYLYGLPDSGRAYYKAYSTHLANHGYQRTTADPCLFVKIINGKRTYVFTHVDDTFICSTDKSELIAFQDMLRLKYEITVNNDVTEYLGIKMTNQPNGDILLTQPKLLGSLLLEYSVELEAIKHTLSPQHLPPMQDFDETPIEQVKYLSLLGALIYLTKSRPDIATAVSFASVFSAKPTAGAYTELLFCLKYLSDTQHLGLLLKRGDPNKELILTCYVDASYLTHSDSKSHSGFCLSFGTIGTFYSKSGKQTLVATSSTHAEMRALYTCVIDIIFVLHLCDELHRPVHKPAIIMEDNQPVIDLTEEFSARSKRCKHFLMLVHYIKEQISSGLIQLSKVPTHENIADILTKIVVGDEFRRKALSLLGQSTLSSTV